MAKLCDNIRIDHFRGFEAYWKVPAGEKTAQNGEWVKAPGQKLFKAIQKELGDIPLIADERIQEVSFGEYEGLGCSKENYEIPDPEFEYFFQAPEKYVAKNGTESIEELCSRTTEFLKEITNNPELEDKTVLIATHGAALKGLLSSIGNKTKKDFWGCGVHRNCAVTKLESHQGVISLIFENKIFYPEDMGTKPTFAK